MGPRDRVQGEERQGRNEVLNMARSVPKVSQYKGGGIVGCPLHGEQSESGALLTLCRKLIRKKQYLERSWESVERRQRGRSFSSSTTAGGGV